MREVCASQRLAEVATHQYGLITTLQLHEIGLDKSAIARRVAAGRLHRVYRGVYAVGHAALSLRARWKAATLFGGEGSALSHRSAAEFWRMLDPSAGAIHITVQTAAGRRQPDGLTIHRIPSLQSHEITIHHGIPATQPQRTLLDLRGAGHDGELRRAIRQAEILDLPVNAAAITPDRATSELEVRFLRLCRRHRLPMPETNAFVRGIRVDFLWREQRLIVETDGYAYHRGSVAFAQDRARDARLASLGYEVLRFTWHQVVQEHATTAALVRSRLRGPSTQSSRYARGSRR